MQDSSMQRDGFSPGNLFKLSLILYKSESLFRFNMNWMGEKVATETKTFMFRLLHLVSFLQEEFIQMFRFGFFVCFF